MELEVNLNQVHLTGFCTRRSIWTIKIQCSFGSLPPWLTSNQEKGTLLLMYFSANFWLCLTNSYVVVYMWSKWPALNRIFWECFCVEQRHMQKIFMGYFYSVACGGHWYLVCADCDVTVWRHIQVSKPTFSRNWLTQYAYSSIRTLNLCVIALNIHSQRSRLRYRRKINSTLRHSSSS